MVILYQVRASKDEGNTQSSEGDWNAGIIRGSFADDSIQRTYNKPIQ